MCGISDFWKPLRPQQMSRVCDDCQHFHHPVYSSQPSPSFTSVVVILVVQQQASVTII